LHRKATDKPFFRTQSVDRVIAELEDLVKNYEGIVHIFNFDDDLLILKKDWFLRFAAEYAERIYKPYGIRYVINARANLLDDARIEALSVSGCYEVQIGFETGCEDLRNGILQKQITNSQLEFVFRRCREKKVRTLAYTMLGIPLETPDTIKTTVRVLAKLKPTLIRMTIFDPFYGTPLYDYCVDNNLFKTNGVELSNHFTMSRLKFDGLTDADIADTELLFPWLLNAEIGLTDYAPLAERYKNSEDRPAVLAADAEISRKHMERHIPHFRYFDGNNFYYNYWDGESD
jgi:radical SAM superfamily enzyme YgiQ (UPF0313 family)